MIRNLPDLGDIFHNYMNYSVMALKKPTFYLKKGSDILHSALSALIQKPNTKKELKYQPTGHRFLCSDLHPNPKLSYMSY